jgi:hypothetical protein
MTLTQIRYETPFKKGPGMIAIMAQAAKQNVSLIALKSESEFLDEIREKSSEFSSLLFKVISSASP